MFTTDTPLFTALKNDKFDDAKKLIGESTKEAINSVDSTGNPPLFYAMHEDWLEVELLALVEALLKKDADPDPKIQVGDTQYSLIAYFEEEVLKGNHKVAEDALKLLKDFKGSESQYWDHTGELLIKPDDIQNNKAGRHNRNLKGEVGYQAYNNKLSLGVYEMPGRRIVQEDRVEYTEDLSEFSSLSKGQREAVFNATFNKMQKLSEDHQDKGGSTLLAVIVDKNNIYTANAGDSSAYLAILDQNGHFIEFKRLNNLHNPDLNKNKIEYNRLKDMGHEPKPRGTAVWETASGLAVSKSVGDLAHRDYGVKHEPEIIEENNVVRENCTSMIIAGCDGLLEKLTEDQLKTLISDNKGKQPHELAKILAQEAHKAGSRDNISVVVTPIVPNASAKAFLIADGHSNRDKKDGAKTSQRIAETFFSTLKIESQELLEPKEEQKVEQKQEQELSNPNSSVVNHKVSKPAIEGLLFEVSSTPPTLQNGGFYFKKSSSNATTVNLVIKGQGLMAKPEITVSLTLDSDKNVRVNLKSVLSGFDGERVQKAFTAVEGEFKENIYTGSLQGLKAGLEGLNYKFISPAAVQVENKMQGSPQGTGFVAQPQPQNQPASTPPVQFNPPDASLANAIFKKGSKPAVFNRDQFYFVWVNNSEEAAKKSETVLKLVMQSDYDKNSNAVSVKEANMTVLYPRGDKSKIASSVAVDLTMPLSKFDLDTIKSKFPKNSFTMGTMYNGSLTDLQQGLTGLGFQFVSSAVQLGNEVQNPLVSPQPQAGVISDTIFSAEDRNLLCEEYVDEKDLTLIQAKEFCFSMQAKTEQGKVGACAVIKGSSNMAVASIGFEFDEKAGTFSISFDHLTRAGYFAQDIQRTFSGLGILKTTTGFETIYSGSLTNLKQGLTKLGLTFVSPAEIKNRKSLREEKIRQKPVYGMPFNHLGGPNQLGGNQQAPQTPQEGGQGMPEGGGGQGFMQQPPLPQVNQLQDPKPITILQPQVIFSKEDSSLMFKGPIGLRPNDPELQPGEFCFNTENNSDISDKGTSTSLVMKIPCRDDETGELRSFTIKSMFNIPSLHQDSNIPVVDIGPMLLRTPDMNYSRQSIENSFQGCGGSLRIRNSEIIYSGSLQGLKTGLKKTGFKFVSPEKIQERKRLAQQEGQEQRQLNQQQQPVYQQPVYQPQPVPQQFGNQTPVVPQQQPVYQPQPVPQQFGNQTPVVYQPQPGHYQQQLPVGYLSNNYQGQGQSKSNQYAPSISKKDCFNYAKSKVKEISIREGGKKAQYVYFKFDKNTERGKFKDYLEEHNIECMESNTNNEISITPNAFNRLCGVSAYGSKADVPFKRLERTKKLRQRIVALENEQRTNSGMGLFNKAEGRKIKKVKIQSLKDAYTNILTDINTTIKQHIANARGKTNNGLDKLQFFSCIRTSRTTDVLDETVAQESRGLRALNPTNPDRR